MLMQRHMGHTHKLTHTGLSASGPSLCPQPTSQRADPSREEKRVGCGVSVQMTHVLHSRWWNWNSLITPVGFPRGSDGKECKRPRFDPWVRKIPWRRAWQPTLVFLPGESHGQRSLAGYSPWGRKELDTAEQLTHSTLLHFVTSQFLPLYLKQKDPYLSMFPSLFLE